MSDFEQVKIEELKDLREKYFQSIKLSQELFIEWIVAKGAYYKINSNGAIAGYFIKSKDNIMVEFYLEDSHIARKEEIFKETVNEFSIIKAYCKSFDHLFLACCHTYAKSSKIIGIEFRDYSSDIVLNPEAGLHVRIAQEKDIPLLLTFKSELYESAEELKFTVSNKMLYMFEKEHELAGCGYLIKILPDKKYYDIGMWTNPVYRKQGYATKIIAYLKKLCIDSGYTPVCGCASENAASRRTLEKNGFLSKHCIIDFNIVC